MDAQKFGAFIAENRKLKGMTQAELAGKIQITDKAVSRWERGIGFPDINSIEPLANALGLSVLEVMKSERAEGSNCSDTDAVEIMKSTIKLEKKNRKQEQTATGLAVFTTIIVAVLCKIANFGNIGGSLLFGIIASVAEVNIYYYMENREDAESRKIHAIIGLIAIVIFAALCCLIILQIKR